MQTYLTMGQGMTLAVLGAVSGVGGVIAEKHGKRKWMAACAVLTLFGAYGFINVLHVVG